MPVIAQVTAATAHQTYHGAADVREDAPTGAESVAAKTQDPLWIQYKMPDPARTYRRGHAI
jgi:hypothetical protein